MKKYTHLSSKERELMSVLHAKRTSISEIARILKRSESTICRELHRKTTVFFRGTYLGESSQNMYKEYWKKSHKRDRLKSAKIKEYVLTRLKRYWSPEIISGRLNRFGIKISYEAIYQYIYDENRQLIEYLPKKHLARKRIWQYRKRKRLIYQIELILILDHMRLMKGLNSDILKQIQYYLPENQNLLY